jgi:hypothetical protein
MGQAFSNHAVMARQYQKRVCNPPIVLPNDVADLPIDQGDRTLSTASGKRAGCIGRCRHYRPNGPNIDFGRGVLG